MNSSSQSSGSIPKNPGRQKANGIASQSMDQPESKRLGLLSRTIVPSLSVRWILPAQIRSRRHNDLVFVGDSFIQLYEFVPSLTLTKLPGRLDLGSRILAASVYSHIDNTPFVDQVIKQEHPNGIGNGLDAGPHELLVLALDSRELAFIYAAQEGTSRITFCCAKKPLPRDVSSTAQFGRHMAIDSKSHTLAICPAAGQFGLLHLKTVPALKTEMAGFDPRRPDKFCPIEEQRYVRVEGLILKMDFLVSTESPARHVVALLISLNEITRLLLYSWKVGQPLRTVKHESCGPHRLPTKDRMPLLMIPSGANASFILATENGLTVYDDVLSTNLRSFHFAISQQFPSDFKASRRIPLWVQYARPARHEGYTKTNDDLYLIREDGRLDYFEIKHGDKTKLQVSIECGHLNINVDAAFALLEGPPHKGGDIGVVGGNMNHGLVFHVEAKKDAVPFQVIPNLAPVRDMALARSTNGSSRLFVCSGQGEADAAVAELRYGLQAHIGFVAENAVECSLWPTAIWVLPTTDHEIGILVSSPTHTFTLQVDSINGSIDSADPELTKLGLQTDNPTFAFAALDRETWVQITPIAISVISLSQKRTSIQHQHPDGSILRSTIHPQLKLCSTVAHINGRFKVSIGTVTSDDNHVRYTADVTTHFMEDEPTSLLFFARGDRRNLVIGTITGWIHVFDIDAVQRLVHLESERVGSRDSETAPVSSLAFLCDPSGRTPSILCGLRCGILINCALNNDVNRNAPLWHESADKRRRGRLSVGTTTVELIADPHNPSRALVECDGRIMLIKPNDLVDQHRLEAPTIFLTDVRQPEYSQPAIRAAAFSSYDTNDAQANILCATNRDVIIASMESEPGITPRKLRTSGDPCRIVYNQPMGKLIVGLEQTKLLGLNSPSRPLRRLFRPAIQVIDPENHVFDTNAVQTMVIGPASSRLTSLLSWTYKSDTNDVDMIVAGLSVDHREPGRCDGLVVYLMMSQAQDRTRPSIRVLHQANFWGRPVHSMALISRNRVLIGAGNDLYIQDPAGRSFSANPVHVLPSPAVSLHFNNHSIHATTARHSLKIFSEGTENRLNLLAEDTGPNETTRNAVCYAGDPEGGLLSTRSSNGGRLIGLVTQQQGELHCAFDALLPQAITCFAEESPDQGITSKRKSYFGSAQDGTIYGFCVLEPDEWALANLVIRWMAGKKAGSRPRVSGAHRRESRRFKPTDMYVNGDELAELFRAGPRELSNLVMEDVPRDVLLRNDQLDPQGKLAELKRLTKELVDLDVNAGLEEVVTAAADVLLDLISRPCFTIPSR